MITALTSVASRSHLSFVRVARMGALSLALLAGTHHALAAPQTGVFTYQGELATGGSPANGSFDMQFRLLDANVGGVQIGATLTNLALSVTNGRFVTQLDFPGAFAGDERWLEIAVRPAGGGAYTVLTPRQRLTSAPYGTFALNAGNASNAATAANALALNGQPAGFYLNANNLTAGTVPSARVSGGYSNALNFSNAGNVFVGNGAGLTGLNAASLSSGTLSDGRLSANVALRNAPNAFTSTNTFSGSATFSGNTPITVNDTNLSGTAFDMNSDGGTIFDIDVVGASITTRGFNVDIDSTTTAYGLDVSITGASGTGYGVYSINSRASGYGGFFNNTSTTGTTYGIWTESNSPDGYGLYAVHDASTGFAPAVFGRTDSTSSAPFFSTSGAFAIHGQVATTTPGSWSAGVRGENQGTTGSGIGVYGSHAGTGWGVYGVAAGAGRGVYGLAATTGDGVYGLAGDGGRGVFGEATGQGTGVRGETADGAAVWGIAAPTTTTELCYGVRGTGGNSDNSYGVYGTVSGTGVGVYGFSTGSYGGYFDTGVAGGPALYVVGTASVGVITIRGGADLAEKFEFQDQQTEIVPGMVVMIDDEHAGGMELAVGSYNKRVAGVVSGANELSAGMILGDFEGKTNPHPVALTGRVWTFVDASEKAVEAGDLLTTSDTPGYAMPVVDASKAHGATIGKAMSTLKQGEKGMVLVLVNLQ
jgi:hypothetical protein